MVTNNYPIFSVIGVEVEYMLVQRQSLEIMPIADAYIKNIAGDYVNEVERDEIAINNELALHVLELKTNGPVKELKNLDQIFLKHINRINNELEVFNTKLMPTGMHPLLQPSKAIKLWPHGNKDIYESYNQIFGCEGHGWINLQSVHINLPFSTDEEFVKLHNAIRILLPIIPGLVASTPFVEGKKTNWLSSRLVHYEKNQQKIPIITGDVIPEYVSSMQEYIDKILTPMYEAIKPLDVLSKLQEEWLNSRGAIARFERNAIEIRIVDSQESSLADMTMIATIVGILKYLVAHYDEYLNNPISHKELKAIYDAVLLYGLETDISHKSFLSQLGINKQSIMLRSLWDLLIQDAASEIDKCYQPIMEIILSHGSLAQRLIRAIGSQITKQNLINVYQKICECLERNTIFYAA